MSAGNDNINFNTSSQRDYPGSYKFNNTITVGSIRNYNNTKSSFSNYGSYWVDIAAPGTGIFSTLKDDDYGMMSGTSMAAPHVAGAAAILCAAYPNETAFQIKSRILNGANENYGVSNGL